MEISMYPSITLYCTSVQEEKEAIVKEHEEKLKEVKEANESKISTLEERLKTQDLGGDERLEAITKEVRT